MKITIQGNLTRDELRELGTLLTNMFYGIERHINVLIEEGTEDMSMEECQKLLNEMFKDKPHYTGVYKKK
jgi:hypothetical protein